MLQSMGFRAVTWSELVMWDAEIRSFSWNGPDFIAVVEQIICASAIRFYPTVESSFSEYVVWLRRFARMPDAECDYEAWRLKMRTPII